MQDERHMRFAARLGAVVLAVALALPGAAIAADSAPRPIRSIAAPRAAGARAAAPRPVIVGLTDPSLADGVRRRVEAMGGTVTARPDSDALVVAAPVGQDSIIFAAALQSLPGVSEARADRIVEVAGDVAIAAIPNDTEFHLQWGLQRIGVPAAWEAGHGSGKLIAIIDSGIDATNPDFAGKIVAGRSFLLGDPSAFADDNGHGTHVAGIAAAVTDNRLGIAGTAPDARLLIAKAIYGNGTGYESDVAAAIRWAADSGADVISLSLATTVARPTLTDPMGSAVTYAQLHGCLVVAAAGNYGGTYRVWPAAYDGVLAVGATEQLDRVASFSTRGTRTGGLSTTVLAAPGVGIMSWWLDGGMANATGTSMATPLVSGSAAVVWAANPTWSATQVTDRLTSTALDLAPAGRDTGSGFGRLRLEVAMGQPASPDALEPDDSPGLAVSGARVLALGTPAWHNVVPTGDTDFGLVDLLGGGRYVIRTSDLSGSADTSMALYAPDATTLLAGNDDAALGDPSSAIYFTAPYSGRYYVAVSDPRGLGGAYVLTASLAGPRATSLSIATSTSRPRVRRWMNLRGSLTPAAPGQRVYLQVLRPGTHHWISAGSGLTYGATSGGGSLWARSYRPTRRGYYRFRARFVGGGDLLGTYSGSYRIRVR
ncbi:MAG: S8 family serine peptidase [Coriobacteriia bacterium]|nr:S8 family serine peptidase [Coriobacteriia bacterium]